MRIIQIFEFCWFRIMPHIWTKLDSDYPYICINIKKSSSYPQNLGSDRTTFTLLAFVEAANAGDFLLVLASIC